jgi:DNA mismatch endonuclease (patch repair protein)
LKRNPVKSNQAPIPLDDAVRRRMQMQARRDTRPELAIRRALHALGLRFRVDRVPMLGMRSRADVVFSRVRVAVFVDGCFWHRCPLHGTVPTNNREWWVEKLAANVDRDRRVDNQLAAAGWRSIRVWEHEDPVEAARQVAAIVTAVRRRPVIDGKSTQP